MWNSPGTVIAIFNETPPDLSTTFFAISIAIFSGMPPSIIFCAIEPTIALYITFCTLSEIGLVIPSPKNTGAFVLSHIYEPNSPNVHFHLLSFLLLKVISSVIAF